LLGREIEATSSIASPSQAKPKTLAKVGIRSNEGDFTLEARECKAKEQRIRCTIAVVNNRSEVSNFRLYPREESILIDDFGNQYQPYEGGFLKKNRYDDSEEIPPGLPMNFFLMYDNVPTTTKYVTVIVQIQRVGKAVLRNIPLSM